MSDQSTDREAQAKTLLSEGTMIGAAACVAITLFGYLVAKS